MNWEMINFLFRWDSSDFLLTYLSLPGGKACGCHRACHPSQISCLPRALVPARLLVLGSRVPFRRPGLGLLSWPRWWVAMTCASSSVSASGSICSPAPFQALLGQTVCVSTRRIFSDSFLFSAQLSSSRGPCPEAQGVPALPCRQRWGICVADTCMERQAWPPRPPSPSRGLLGWGWLTAV